MLIRALPPSPRPHLPSNHVGLVETHRLPKSPLLTSGLLSQAPIICVSQHLSKLWEQHLLKPPGLRSGLVGNTSTPARGEGMAAAPKKHPSHGFPFLTLPLLYVIEVKIKVKNPQWNASTLSI